MNRLELALWSTLVGIGVSIVAWVVMDFMGVI